jgi:hypothetical protein
MIAIDLLSKKGVQRKWIADSIPNQNQQAAGF